MINYSIMWIRKICKNIFFIPLLICAGFPAIANDVQKAQRLLTELGFNPGPIDGAFGNKTELALINFYVSNGRVYDGYLDDNEIIDLVNFQKNSFADCSFVDDATAIRQIEYIDEMLDIYDDTFSNEKYFPNYRDTRYGPFLYWMYENSKEFTKNFKPVDLDQNQKNKLIKLEKIQCSLELTGRGQRAYTLAILELLYSLEGFNKRWIQEGNAILWDEFPYIETGNNVIDAPKLNGLEYYKKYISTSGVMIVGGQNISDKAMLSARAMLKYQLSARPDLHYLFQENKMRISLFRKNTCTLPEFDTFCEDGGFAMSETDATMTVNSDWLCYPGNKEIGGNPLFHEWAHSMQHIIFESTNDLYFYERLPSLIDQAYRRNIAPRQMPAGEVWAIAVEGYMMDGGKRFKDSYHSREYIKKKHPEMYQMIIRYFPTTPSNYCRF